MKFANIVKEWEVVPNGLSFAYRTGPEVMRGPNAEKDEHEVFVFLRFGEPMATFRFIWKTTRPRCPVCRKFVARAGRCLMCIALAGAGFDEGPKA